MSIRLVIFATACLIAREVVGADYFVATNGSPANPGTISQPWDLYGALFLKTANVTGGDTIWLRGGTYVGPTKVGEYGTNMDSPAWRDIYGNGGAQKSYFSWLAGTSADAPVVVRPYSNELVMIDGGIHCFGKFVVWRDLVITNSYQATRLDTNSMYRAFGFWAGSTSGSTAYGNKLINCIIANTGHAAMGFNSDARGEDNEMYGNIIWGVGVFEQLPGWNGAPRGAAVYSQNDNSGGRLTSAANIIWGCFTYGIGVDGSAYVDNCTTEDNIVFNLPYHNNPALGFECRNTTDQSHGLIMRRNYTFSELGMGLSCASVGVINTYYANDVAISNNVFVAGTFDDLFPSAAGDYKYGGIQIFGFTNISFSANQVIGVNGRLVNIAQVDGLSPQAQWDNNQYWSSGTSEQPFGMDVNPSTSQYYPYSFTNWTNSTGYDLHSTLATSSYPTGTWTYVITNKYEQGRAHLMIYNWGLSNSLSVNLSGTGLTNGQGYVIRDVQYLFGPPVLTGSYSNSNPSVTLPMNLTTFSVIPGWDTNVINGVFNDATNVYSAVTALQATNGHTSPRYQVFFVRDYNADNWSTKAPLVTTNVGTLAPASNLRVLAR